MASFDITGPTYYYGNVVTPSTPQEEGHIPDINIFDALKVLDVVTTLYSRSI